MQLSIAMRYSLLYNGAKDNYHLYLLNCYIICTVWL